MEDLQGLWKNKRNSLQQTQINSNILFRCALGIASKYLCVKEK